MMYLWQGHTFKTNKALDFTVYLKHIHDPNYFVNFDSFDRRNLQLKSSRFGKLRLSTLLLSSLDS
jgi:lipopolysaccharide assembly outer membrane protein LptD (OstA)